MNKNVYHISDFHCITHDGNTNHGHVTMYVEAHLPIDPEEAAEDVDAGVAAVEALWRRVLDALGDGQVLEVVLLVDGLGPLQQRLHVQLVHRP